MPTKSAPLASFKALDEGSGTFTAVVSVFGNVDLVGDRVVKGAFADSLQAWKAKGDPIPVIWSHKWDDPFMHLGEVTKATETDEGLEVTGQLDLDAPIAAQVFRLLKARRVTQFSFAFDIDGQKEGADGVNELTALSLIEVGPTLKGANPATTLGEVKRAPEAKAADLEAAVQAQEGAQESPAGSEATEEPGKEACDAQDAAEAQEVAEGLALSAEEVKALLDAFLPLLAMELAAQDCHD